MGAEVVDRINELLDDVDEKVESLRGKINGILSWVPWGMGWVVDKFMGLWDGAMNKLGEFWDLIRNIVANLGQPWVLNRTETEWLEVGGPVAELAPEATRGQSDVDFEWKGRAADRYALALGEQRSAIVAVRDRLTSVIGPALGAVATALYLFFGTVIAAIAAMIAGIVLATGEAVSLFGLPAVPPTVYLAIVAAISSIAIGTNVLLGAARSADSVFTSAANNTGDFGAGNWPAAVI